MAKRRRHARRKCRNCGNPMRAGHSCRIRAKNARRRKHKRAHRRRKGCNPFGPAVPYQGKRLTFIELLQKYGGKKAAAIFGKARTRFEKGKVLRAKSACERMDLLKKAKATTIRGRRVYVAPVKTLKLRGKCRDCGAKAKVYVTEHDGASRFWCGVCDIGENPARRKRSRRGRRR